MARTITEHSFFQYLNCPSWVYFDAHATEPRPQAVLMQKLQTDGLLDEYSRSIWSAREDVVEVICEDQEEAFQQTLSYMRDGHQTIVGGVLIDKHWVGRPDLLERVEGRSRLGDYYYVAADVKRTRVIRDLYKFQSCFYAELLERIQDVKPMQGYVITHTKESLSFLIEDFESKYRLTLEEIEKILVGQRPEHFLSSGCKQSPWFLECHTKTKECNDLSMLNRIWREEVVRLRNVGINTVKDLATRSIHEITALEPNIEIDRLQVIRDQAVALLEKKVIIRHPIVLPNEKQVLYFDVESDPLRDWEYLFGILDDKNNGNYHSFLAKTPEEEGDMWRSFVSYIEQHTGAIIYHYGEFERQVISRFIAKYGISDQALKTLDVGMVDLLVHMRPAVVFPLPFYSLKDLATFMGFSWRAEDASGANSVMWFEDWLKTGNQETLQKILDYNEDDVRATKIVRDWIHEYAEHLI